MKPNPTSPDDLPVEDGGADSEVERRFAAYIDRLNRGEAIDADEVRCEHPTIAEELLEGLRDFEELTRSAGAGDASASPRAFGDYEIHGELGRGGMGVVYDARERSLDRRVALKILPPGLMIDSRSLARFRQEARVVGKLKHANIVSVHATGVEGETPYIAMEFVEGESLDRILERKRPRASSARPRWSTRLFRSRASDDADVTRSMVTPPATPVDPSPLAGAKDDTWSPIPSSPEELDLSYCIRMSRAFAAVADGLAHAHSRDVVHRDLKPSNLVFERDGTLRILDFGLARVEGQDKLTASGEIVGTPRYMSPEQAGGGADSIGPATDIYSLGATLYEVLTLHAPFEGRTAQDTISQILHREPRSPRAINPRIPRDLETIVLKCLRKAPADRYRSAADLRDDLTSFSRGDPIEARPLSLVEKSRLFARRHGKALGVAALIVAAVWFAWSSLRESRARLQAEYGDRVVDAMLSLQRNTAFSPSVGRFTWERMSYDIEAISAGLEAVELPNEHVIEAIDTLEDAASSVPDRPEAHYHLGNAYLLLGKTSEGVASLERAVELGFVPAMAMLADYEKYRDNAERAASLLARARETGDARWVPDWLAAHAAIRERRWAEAARIFDRLIDLEQTTRPFFLGSSVEMYLHGGLAKLEGGDHRGALRSFDRIAALQPGAVEPEVLRAVTLHADGKRRECDRILEELHARHASRDGLAELFCMVFWARLHDFPRGLYWANRLSAGFSRELWRATFLSYLRRHREAYQAARQLPELRPDTPLGYFLAATTAMQTGRFEEAERFARKTVDMAPESSVPLTVLAGALAEQGKYLPAYMALQRAMRIEPDAPAPHYFIAFSQRGMRQTDAAMASLKKAISLAPEGANLVFPIEMAHHQLGLMQLETGKYAEAAQSLTRAIELGRDGVDIRASWFASLANAQRASGDRDAALATLEDGMQQYQGNSAQVRPLGDLHEEIVLEILPSLPTCRSVEIALDHASQTALIPYGASWKYFTATEAPAPDELWTAASFDDSSWEQAAAGLGYGSVSYRTEIPGMAGKTTRVWARHVFELEEAAIGELEVVQLLVRIDDGCIAWVNGREIGRARAPLADATDAARHVASAAASEPPPIEVFSVDRSLLRPGRNVVALLGFNVSLESSDFVLDPTLRARVRDAANGHESLIESYAKTDRQPGKIGRLAYLRGLAAKRSGRHEQAVEWLSNALAHHRADASVAIALAESLRQLGKPLEAARHLESVLRDTCPGDRRAWMSWLGVQFADLGREPGALRNELPCVSASTGERDPFDQSPPNPAEQAAWLIDRLATSGVVRINCGGEAHVDATGERWEGDAFHVGGAPYANGNRKFSEEILETEDDALYQTERYFFDDEDDPGYSIPVPPGSYALRLHVAEIYHQEPAQRQFHVLVEDVRQVESLCPGESGFATARQTDLEVDVTDGVLDIRFERVAGKPKLSAIALSKAR